MNDKMDDDRSKNLIESLLRTALQSQPGSLTGSGTSNRNNIVLMNPEIHLHNNEGSSEASTNNDVLKKIQDELQNERHRREFEERRRHEENMRNQNLLREKDSQIKNQNEILSLQVEILNEQRSYLEKIYALGPRQQINHFGKWKGKSRPNRSFKNADTKKNAQHFYRDHRMRSKTTNSPELWEWNGDKWIAKISNGSLHQNQISKPMSCRSFTNKQKNVDGQSPKEGHLANGEKARQDSRASREETATNHTSVQSHPNGTSQNTIPMTVEQMSKVTSHRKQVESNEIFYLDDDMNVTHFSEQPGAAGEITFPTNISISFDENEMINRSSRNKISISRKKQH